MIKQRCFAEATGLCHGRFATYNMREFSSEKFFFQVVGLKEAFPRGIQTVITVSLVDVP